MAPTEPIAVQHVSFVKTLIINSAQGGMQADHWTAESGWTVDLWPQSGVIQLRHRIHGHHMLVGPSQWQSVWVQDGDAALGTAQVSASEEPAPLPDHEPAPQKRMTAKQKLDAETRLARIRAGADLP